MDQPYKECCFNCKHWTAIDEAGVDSGELVASYVEALEERKKAGDVNGYHYVLNRLSKIIGTCQICLPHIQPVSRIPLPVASALSRCGNRVPKE